MTGFRVCGRLWTVGALALVVVTGCSGSGSDDTAGDAATRPAATRSSDPGEPSSTTLRPSSTTVRPSSTAASTTSVAPPTTTPSAVGELPSLPLPGFAFQVDSEFEVARDLRGLTSAGALLFAFTPPDTMLRIDPARRAIESIELGIGPSVGGAPSWAVTDNTMWVIGGAFRNQLIEIDTSNMREVRRISLDDDHSVAAATDTDVWLTTTHAIRRFDIKSDTLESPIELDVDAGNVAVGPGGMVWVSLPAAAQVARVDPATDHVDRFEVAPGPGWLDSDHTAVWVSHPPIASVSQLDPVTGETVELIDLDLSGGTVASAQTGALQATDDGVWVAVSFPGSPYRSAFALIERSGQVVGARSVQFDSHTWEAVDGEIWIHRLPASSIVRSAIDDFGSAPATDVHHLLPISDTADTVATTPPPGASDDERSLLAALDTVLDVSVPAADLGLEAQANARQELSELAAAQAELRVEPTSVIIDEATGTTVFDVVIEGDTVILPAVELEWRLVAEQTWHLDPASFCRLADGVGIIGCTP